MQTAVVSLLEDDDMKYTRNFFYWAAFISHGFASVKLDDALLDQIHERLGKIQQESSDDKSSSSSSSSRDDNPTPDNPLARAMLARTRDAYHRLEDREETTLSHRCGITSNINRHVCM